MNNHEITGLPNVLSARLGAKAITENGTYTASDENLDGYNSINVLVTNGATVVEEKDINFWDYDGRLIYSFTFGELQSLTELPTPTDHSEDDVPLTFQEWNWTLTDLKLETIPRDVGAIYTTTDGWTYCFLDIQTTQISQFRTYIYKSDTSTLTYELRKVSDNSLIFTDTSTSSGTVSKDITGITEIGKYYLRLKITTGTGKYKIGGNSTYLKFISGSGLSTDIVYWALPYKIKLSNDVTGFYRDSFEDFKNLETLNIPNTVIPETTNQVSIFEYSGIKHLNIPTSYTRLDEDFLKYSIIKTISLPKNCDFDDNVFERTIIQKITLDSLGIIGIFISNIYLKNVYLSSNITIIQSESFSFCKNITKIKTYGDVTQIKSLAFSAMSSCLEFDFTNCTAVPTLDNINAFGSGSISTNTVIKVPSALYADWIIATNWSTYASNIVSV